MNRSLTCANYELSISQPRVTCNVPYSFIFEFFVDTFQIITTKYIIQENISACN
jgi:hypothetical protein